MKWKIFFCLLFLHLPHHANAAADTSMLPLKNVSVIVNSVNNFYLLIDFRLGLDSNVVDDEYLLMDKAGKPQFHITYQGAQAEGSCMQAHPYASRSGFGVKVEGFTEKQIKYFLAKDNQVGIRCDKDFIIRYYKATLRNPGVNDYHYGIVKAIDVNKLINKNLTITDSERSSYISNVNNFYYFENKIDAGVDPGSDGRTAALVLSASIRNKYFPSKFISCNAPAQKYAPRLFWSLSTRLSTNSADSLTFISFSPVHLCWASANFARELNIKLSSESDQAFTNKRAALDASFRNIIPNLVSLTTPQDNRLRLKPIVNVGAKGYYDYSNGLNSFYSGQAYGKLYYYIPIYNNYSIVINGTAFYDVSRERNPDHKLNTNYSITVASEIASTGYKVIAKYENGKSDIDYKAGRAIVLGLLMDFLKEQK